MAATPPPPHKTTINIFIPVRLWIRPASFRNKSGGSVKGWPWTAWSPPQKQLTQQEIEWFDLKKKNYKYINNTITHKYSKALVFLLFLWLVIESNIHIWLPEWHFYTLHTFIKWYLLSLAPTDVKSGTCKRTFWLPDLTQTWSVSKCWCLLVYFSYSNSWRIGVNTVCSNM